MPRLESRRSDAPERAGEESRGVPKAGPAGPLLATLIILALIAITMLGITLLFRN
jgi:hypothetical protein